MMGDFHWYNLKPEEKVLFVLLTISATAASMTLIVMVLKLLLEWAGYRETKALVRVANDLLRADAQVRAEITHRTRRAEAAAEGTQEAIHDLQKKAEKVERATVEAKEAAEQIKQVVVEGVTPQSLPKVSLPLPPPS